MIVMIYILIAVSFLTFDVWVYMLYLVHKKQKIQNGSVRGIIKHYNNGNLDDDLSKLVKKWLFVFITLFIVAYLWVFYLTWGSDFNFLIAIYPFVWHYMFFRYFLWEKVDLLDHPAQK
jgi:hypothetical protein